ncbi:MAG TPA: exodeoxyribonuclease VII small subunit [Pseudonocardiaceae bacterium]|jgi:exodeoxyribonuclease VII small subunit|nr:exodeoxyribonuclease VII small subunit [Pseudonocardiaceae bacterium]
MTASAARKNNRDKAESGEAPESSRQDGPALGYEAARDELVEVVRRLEAGGLSLEDSLSLWERGEALASTCERQLAGARDRVEAALSRVEHADEDGPEEQRRDG